MSTLWFHSAPKMTSGARYGSDWASPSQVWSSGNAEPKSHSTAYPKSLWIISRLATMRDSSLPGLEGLGDDLSLAQNSSRNEFSSSGSVSWILSGLMSGFDQWTKLVGLSDNIAYRYGQYRSCEETPGRVATTRLLRVLSECRVVCWPVC